MKKFIYSMAAIATIFGLSACSSEEDVPSVVTGDAADTYVELSIGLPSSATRADEEYDNKNETSGEYLTGIVREYKIFDVDLYFFRTVADESGAVGTLAYKLENVPVKLGGSHTTSTAGYEGSTDYGVAYSTGTIKIEKSSGLLRDVKYHMYALCNMGQSGSTLSVTPTVNTTTEADFTASTILSINKKYNCQPITYNENAGMPMATRGYYQNDEAVADGGSTVFANFTYTEQNNINNPVVTRLYVERSYARVTLAANSEGKFWYDLVKPSTTTANQTATEAEKLGKVELVGYKVINKNLNYNTFRQVGSEAGALATNPFGALSTTDNAENQFLMTPSYTAFSTGTFSASVSQANLTNSYTSGTSNLSGFVGFTKITEDSNTYAILDYPAENAMAANSQFQGYCTGVLFKALLRPNAAAINNATSNKTYTPGVSNLYAYESALYADLSDLPIEVTENNFHDYGVTKYVKGYCYYLYFIRHLDNYYYPTIGTQNGSTATDMMGDMEFAIVRSNTYDLSINSIALTTHTNPNPGGGETPDPYDPGDEEPGVTPPTPPTIDDPDTPDDETPTPDEGDVDPDDPGFNPDDPSEVEYNYMNTRLVVRPWIVRTQNVVFVE